MRILAFEFSGPERSVAALFTDAHGEVRVISEAVEAGGRSVNAFKLTEQVLAEAGMEREQVEVLAVGLGPGSYIGARMAISIAQGWEAGLKVRLMGVSSAEAIAMEACLEGLEGDVSVVIDAQRGEFYLADYEVGKAGYRETGALRITGREEVLARSGAGSRLIGPEVGKWFPEGGRMRPSARAVARIAAGRREFKPGDQLEPIYLRPVSFVKAPAPRLRLG